MKKIEKHAIISMDKKRNYNIFKIVNGKIAIQ